MEQFLEKIEIEIRKVKNELEVLRARFDKTDVNHPIEQNIIAQQISKEAIKLETLENLYNMLKK